MRTESYALVAAQATSSIRFGLPLMMVLLLSMANTANAGDVTASKDVCELSIQMEVELPKELAEVLCPAMAEASWPEPQPRRPEPRPVEIEQPVQVEIPLPELPELDTDDDYSGVASCGISKRENNCSGLASCNDSGC